MFSLVRLFCINNPSEKIYMDVALELRLGRSCCYIEQLGTYV